MYGKKSVTKWSPTWVTSPAHCALGRSAYMSLQSCLLEIRAGLLCVLPLANNPMNRRWNVVHLEHKPLSQVASVFMDYLIRHGQTQIEEQLAMMSKLPVAEAVVLHSNPTEPEQPSP